MRYVITLLLLCITTTATWAQTFAYDGYNFEVLDETAKTAQIIAASNPEDYADNLKIPETATWTIGEGKSKTSKTYTVTTIATRAFDGCPKLLSITMPESITTVELNAIANCPNLYTVTFGPGLTQKANLGTSMFEECNKLSHINYMGTSKEILRALKSLLMEQYLPPVIHCQPSLSDVKNVLPFDHVSMTKNDSYQKGAYSSFVTYLPLDFTDTGLTAIIAISLPTKDDNTITYRQVTKVPAGTAIFIQGSEEAYDQDIVVPVITDAKEIAEAEQQVKDNKLQGSTTDVYVLKPVEEEKLYAINKITNTLRYIDPVTIPYLRSNMTYFPVNQQQVTTVAEFRLVAEGSLDAEHTESLPAHTAVPTTQAYDLHGRPVADKTQGLVITQGKKLINQ